MQYFHMASAKGVTTLHDCGIGSQSMQTDYAALLDLYTNKKYDPPVRMSGFLVYNEKAWDFWINEKGI